MRLTERPAWRALGALAAQPLPHLRELVHEPGRGDYARLSAAGIELDFTRQRINRAVHDALLALAQDAGIEAQRDAMLAGEPVNATEGRAVLHVALRGGADAHPPWGSQLAAEIDAELARACDFADAVRDGRVRGFGGAPIRHVVSLGIGGSDLGPRMACEALAAHASDAVQLHFVSNPDPAQLYAVLRQADPAATLFLVSSKTFTTHDTLINAASARQWLLDHGCPAQQVPAQFAAITANAARAVAEGYLPQQVFRFWDWVGGRYSLWSAIGLPVMIAAGPRQFRALLDGAHAMDTHFRSAPLARNLPVAMALCGIWNRNFLGAPTQLVAPYAAPLARLPAYLQQQDMESCGKRVDAAGRVVGHDTGPIVWGGLGLDGQHAYFQLLHQGTHLVPADLIGTRRCEVPLPQAQKHHQLVLANLLAQASALSCGRTHDETLAALSASGLPPQEAELLAPHRTFPGNVPVSLLWLDTLDAASLGALIALYEHKVFVQAAIWGIHAYDQWGVELGKAIASDMQGCLARREVPKEMDPVGAATLASLVG
ncbi:glucose-6-phosphate isomerase [Cupriavidus sp. SK-4]|uniref:glucose-6-phosphate isomerase n=1 Tax=Cupriavidus sp. SK-4 TaxID=574750 RepID=UPI0004461F42|nr:glucose-6-phosphate isomerase [Cupriavidus sp. SK-4]EYS93156.1 glucose-6-phosphate isomerase [Cupriavidus sp. SK-4]